ncbi:TlpA disulfide reductase family protein [Massilia sp. W12]|uniref:TlpA disulfide reductase family protein n=1 Tax=Massilia sp. W12 TaxID=3126507 RepID=UPI0030CAF2BA
MQTKKLVLPLLTVLLVAGAGLWGYQSLTARQAAPHVEYTNLQGKKFDSASLRGKVVMVNFWATSCASCVREMPQMVETWQKYNPRGLEFVAVAMQYDPPNYVINYAETRKLPFHVALDYKGELAKAFGNVSMTPTTFVIDKQGRIVKRYVGEPSFAELHQLLEKELA